MVRDVAHQGDMTIEAMVAMDVTTEAMEEIETIDEVATTEIAMRRPDTTTGARADTGMNGQGTMTGHDTSDLLGTTETTIVLPETIDHHVTDRLCFVLLLPRECVIPYVVYQSFLAAEVGSVHIIVGLKLSFKDRSQISINQLASQKAIQSCFHNSRIE